jgi:ParB family transcriptional regulator, chromosome partitioning protein
VASRKSLLKPQLSNVAAILNRKVNPEIPSSPLIPINKIHLPAHQPRRFFDADRLAQLVKSVKEHGILEPLLVRPLDNGDYELVAGERRLRAAREVGLEHVPIIAKQLDDREAMHVALIENLQREDLNPVEETDAVLSLLELTLSLSRDEVISLFYRSHHAKHRGQDLGQNVLSQLDSVQEVMEEIGRFSIDSFRSSRLPLLKLPDDVLNTLREGLIEYTKGQAIGRVKDENQRKSLLLLAIEENLSLKQIRERIKELNSEKVLDSPQKNIQSLTHRVVQAKLWENPRKWKKAEALLLKLEALITDD